MSKEAPDCLQRLEEISLGSFATTPKAMGLKWRYRGPSCQEGAVSSCLLRALVLTCIPPFPKSDKRDSAGGAAGHQPGAHR